MEHNETERGMNVFKNFKNFSKPTADETIKQAHPNVVPYPWMVNRSRVVMKTTSEKGSFFNNTARSGVGAVGVEGTGKDVK
jgi:hypothetical protein